MRKFWQIFSITVIIAVCSCPLQAWDLVISMDRPDGQYKIGETAVFTLKAIGSDVPDAVISANLSLDGGKVLDSKRFSLKDGAVFSGTLDQPGFLKVTVSAKVGSKRIIQAKGAAFEPEKITAGAEVPADFLTWWQQELAEAKANAAPVEEKELPQFSVAGKFKCYLLSVAVDGGKVYGFLTVPESPEPLPAVVMIAAAGSDMSKPVMNQFGNRWAVLFLNVHDVDPLSPQAAQFRKSIHNTYNRQNSGDREKYFFHRVICGMNIMIDHLAARKEINGRQIGAFGTSQGGGLSLILTALNPNIKAAAVDVPALCDLNAATQNRGPGWPKMVSSAVPGSSECAKYYDAANFCAFINVPVWVVVGFEDTTCPPGSVYAAFNRIKFPGKVIVPEVNKGHRGSSSFGDCVGKMRSLVVKQK